MKHALHNRNSHTEISGLDDEPPCQICDGGLSCCTVCKGAEASLPTECPGRVMTKDERAAINAGLIDFRHNKWIRL